MKNLRTLLEDLADLQNRRQQEADDIDAGEHSDYGLYDELKDDIADLVTDNADMLAALLDKADTLATNLADFDTADEEGEDNDGHDEAIRVATRDLVTLAGGSTTPDATDHNASRAPSLAALRGTHAQALRAADGDSNDDEIAAWRDTAELATALLPDYAEPIID